MKKLIISNKQLGCLSEVAITRIADDATSGAYIKASTNTNAINDLTKAKQFDKDVAMNVYSTKNGKEPDEQCTVDVNVPEGESVQSVVNSDPAISRAAEQGANWNIHGDGFGESKIYTKKAVEEARLKKMRAEGKVFTKKSLFESFFDKSVK